VAAAVTALLLSRAAASPLATAVEVARPWQPPSAEAVAGSSYVEEDAALCQGDGGGAAVGARTRHALVQVRYGSPMAQPGEGFGRGAAPAHQDHGLKRTARPAVGEVGASGAREEAALLAVGGRFLHRSGLSAVAAAIYRVASASSLALCRAAGPIFDRYNWASLLFLLGLGLLVAGAIVAVCAYRIKARAGSTNAHGTGSESTAGHSAGRRRGGHPGNGNGGTGRLMRGEHCVLVKSLQACDVQAGRTIVLDVMDMEGAPWLKAHVTLPPQPGAARGGALGRFFSSWRKRDCPVVLLQALPLPGRSAESGQVLARCFLAPGNEGGQSMYIYDAEGGLTGVLTPAKAYAEGQLHYLLLNGSKARLTFEANMDGGQLFLAVVGVEHQQRLATSEPCLATRGLGDGCHRLRINASMDGLITLCGLLAIEVDEVMAAIAPRSADAAALGRAAWTYAPRRN